MYYIEKIFIKQISKR